VGEVSFVPNLVSRKESVTEHWHTADYEDCLDGNCRDSGERNALNILAFSC